MKALDNIRKELAKHNRSERNPALEAELAMIGQEMCEEAFASKERGNVTFNQHDAFVWALYFNGETIDHGFAGPRKADSPRYAEHYDGKQLWGREEATELIHEFEGNKESGYTLLVSNAIWYSLRQERAGQAVISQMYFMLEDLRDKYHGTLRTGNLKVIR